ncbi:MAG: Hemerythrin cation binding domain [Frankiales bacterium]|nr:Hemerythrin cation binding domain [Frankiales bacterium]
MRSSPETRNALFEELRWVHDKLRRDLTTIRGLAAKVDAGATSATVEAALRSLQAKGPLWQLKVNCLTYCQFVHGHHGNEDMNIFPAVRRADPTMRKAVDRLVADHARVSDLLDEVEVAARFLGDDPASRTRTSAALTALSAHLLEHLAYEEKVLEPVLAKWKTWPGHR